MGKDREGKYHPPKGKPSGKGKNEEIEIHSADPDQLEEYEDLKEKYTEGPDELGANVRLMHPNRNVDKDEDRKSEKENSRRSRNIDFGIDRTDTVPEELPVNPDSFTRLANYTSPCCISIFMPTHSAGVEVNEEQDLIDFKTMLQYITGKLKEQGIDELAIARMLEPGYNLTKNQMFWHGLSSGLAVFMADGFFGYMKLPVSPLEHLLINRSFYISPLIPVITNSAYFYILVISKKQAKFYRADAFGIEPVEVDELPNGMSDVVHFEEKDDPKLFRKGGNRAGAGFDLHGLGAGTPDEKTHIALYLEEVDETLWKKILHTENAPLLLAGVDYLIPIYKQVAGYKHIWDDAITGNYEHEDIQSLYSKAREKMEPYFQQKVTRALENYGNQSATSLTSSIPADVIPAAYYGRISDLFIQKGEHVWGTFDEQNNQLNIHEKSEEGDECLIDKAAVKTLLMGGKVYILEKEQMPADSNIAALMRY